MITAISTPNIALIKYWGNRQNDVRLPAADSLSMVLDSPSVQISVEPSEQFRSTSFDASGTIVPQSQKSIERLEKHWRLVQTYLKTIGRLDGVPDHVSLVIRSEIPPAIGLASSAAIFSCLAEAYGALVAGDSLSRRDISILGRLGAGSGARNAWGGYVALENHGEGIASAYGRQIADVKHWPLFDIVLIPSQEEKKIGSTEGHEMASTSPLFKNRIAEIPRRMTECITAIQTKDFEKLQKVSEEDSLDMHRVMETQTPSLRYLSDETHHILREIEAMRISEHLEVLYTMDAGPTVHLICTEESKHMIEEFADAQKHCVVFKTKVGNGSRLQV